MTEEPNKTESSQQVEEQRIDQQMSPNGGRWQQKGPATSGRKVAEGAMLVALAVVLGLLAFYLPVFSIVAVFLWPIPIAVLIKKHGFSFGVLGLIIVGLLLALFMGPVSAFFLLLNMGGVGLWYGYAARKDTNPGKTLFVGVVIAALSVIATTLLSAQIIGVSLSSLANEVKEMTAQAVQMYENAGVLDALSGGMTVEEFTAEMQEMMLTLLPAVLVISAMLEAWISYLATNGMLRRLGFAVKHLPRFSEWHLPWASLWGLIIALAAQIAYYALDVEWLKTIAMNLLYIYIPILAAAGLSLVFWFSARRQSSFLKILIIIGIFLFPAFVLYLLLMMGLIDCIADIRKWIDKMEQQMKQGGPKQ